MTDPTGVATVQANDRPTEGSDDIIGSDEPDEVYLLGGHDRFSGAGGNDWIDGGAGDDDISGGAGDDTIVGGAGSNILNGDAGRDRFVIGEEMPATYNTIFGGADRDTVDAGQAAYAMRFERLAGSPDQQVSITHLTTGYGLGAASGVEHWIGGSAGDLFSFAGMGAGLTVEGEAGNDVITGGNGNDVLLGGDGDDVILIEQGNDSIDGGHGFDTVEFGNVAAGALVNGFADGSFEASAWTAAASVTGVERIVGSIFADELNFTFTTVAVTLDGGGGDDYVVGGTAADRLAGGEGNDVLDGGIGADTLFGDGGDDRLVIANVTDGLMDMMHGGSGNDLVDGRDSSAGLYVSGDGSTMTVWETDDWNIVAWADEVESLIGSGHDDEVLLHWMDAALTLDGAGGNDILMGGRGDDLVQGGAGDDYLRGEQGQNVLDGGEGNDQVGFGFTSFAGVDIVFQENSLETPWVVSSDQGTDSIVNVESMEFGGSYFDDRATGGSGDDWLSGNDGDDLLAGGDGDDELFGGEGADVLSGGLGADLLEGGTWTGDGADIYVYTSLAQSNAAFGTDTLLNHGSSDDRIDLSRIDIDASTPEVETPVWVFVGEEHRPDVGGAQATLHYDYVREGTVLRLFLDDGDSLADFELLISGARVDQSMLIGTTDLAGVWMP